LKDVQRGLPWRFTQIGLRSAPSELSSSSPLARSRQRSFGDLPLDSAPYDGPAIATCCTPAGFMLLEGSNTEPFVNKPWWLKRSATSPEMN
jgi:hypothetical protein